MAGDALTIVSAATVSLEAYAAAFTSAFQGYYHPISHDAGTLARRVRCEQYDLENSLLAYDGGEVAGVAALSVRGERGWVAGLAVVPEQRGRGRGRELMSALLERVRALGLRRLSLEVMAVNTAARRLYERVGMSVTRDLLVLERPSGYAADKTRRTRPPKRAPPDELLNHYERLHAEPPAWQRELSSLLAANLRGLHVGGRKRPRAYALVGYGRDGNTYLSDLAAADAEQAGALCVALDDLPGVLRVINEPERSLFVAPLQSHGFSEIIRQHEMTLEL